MPSDTRVDEREDLGEAIRAAFARPATGQELVPLNTTQVAVTDAIITAQKVAVERDEGKVLGKIRTLAHAVGEEFYYRFPVKSRGQTNWIEGPSIKCANNVARLYGNCQVDTRIVDNGDSWIIYAKFVDYETGFSYTRPFQQRKNQGSIRGDADRQLDIALQIGISKAIRNVICNALETFTNYAFEEAKSAIVGRVGKNLDAYRDRVMGRLTEMQVDLHRVEFTVGRASKDWLAPDVARIITQLQAINDGMATVDETWPPQQGGDKPADARPTRDQFTETETKTEEPFTVTDMRGEEFTMADLDHAVDAYHSILDAAAKQGEKALGTAIDNNGLFFTQLDERGHADLSRELSLEGGKRREAARNVPRGTADPAAAEPTTEPELRSNDAAERPGVMGDPLAQPPERQGESTPAAPAASAGPAAATISPAGPHPKQEGDVTAVGRLESVSKRQTSTPPPAGDLLATKRDPKFWEGRNGKRTLLAADSAAFMGELPLRLAECRDWADTEDVERHNKSTINKLSVDERVEISGLFARRREELRGV